MFDPEACEEKEKPEVQHRTCGNRVCPPSWWTGPWQRCRDPCIGVRRRTVLCTTSTNQALQDSACGISPRPLNIQSCKESPECTTERIQLNLGNIKPGYLVHQQKNIDQYSLERNYKNKTLDEEKGKWQKGEWSQCSMPCGPGISHR